MPQAKKIRALDDQLKSLVERMRKVGQSPWCYGMDIVGICESQIETIDMALTLAKREAYSYDLHRRNWKEYWDDFWDVLHLAEHQKLSRLLRKLRGVVYHLEKKFSYPNCRDLTRDDAIRIVYGLHGNLETHPSLPFCASYAGIVPWAGTQKKAPRLGRFCFPFHKDYSPLVFSPSSIHISFFRVPISPAIVSIRRVTL